MLTMIVNAVWLAAAACLVLTAVDDSGDASNEFLSAVTSGDAAKVALMLEKNPSLAKTRDADDVSAVLKSLYYRKPDVTALLVAGRTDLDVLEAAATGDAARLKALLADDATVAGAVSPDGFSPLGYAAFFGREECAAALLAAGADPNLASRNAMKVAPLHSAASSGSIAIARMLLDAGADPNARQQLGVTPLFSAAASGQVDMAELLIARGADVNARSEDGKTALSYAIERKHDAIAAFLRGRGATED